MGERDVECMLGTAYKKENVGDGIDDSRCTGRDGSH